DSDITLGILVIALNILITDRPVDAMTVADVSFEVKIGEPIAMATPENGSAADNVCANPVETFYFCVRVFNIINIEMLVVAAETEMPALYGMSFAVFMR